MSSELWAPSQSRTRLYLDIRFLALVITREMILDLFHRWVVFFFLFSENIHWVNEAEDVLKSKKVSPAPPQKTHPCRQELGCSAGRRPPCGPSLDGTVPDTWRWPWQVARTWLSFQYYLVLLCVLSDSHFSNDHRWVFCIPFLGRGCYNFELYRLFQDTMWWSWARPALETSVYVIFHRLHAINSLRVVFPVVFSPLSSCTLEDGGY